MCCLQSEGTVSLIQSCCLQVVQWRETRHMTGALEGRCDSSTFSEANCASLAASSAPGCRLVEIYNSHGLFLPQLAAQGGLQGNVITIAAFCFHTLTAGSVSELR